MDLDAALFYFPGRTFLGTMDPVRLYFPIRWNIPVMKQFGSLHGKAMNRTSIKKALVSLLLSLFLLGVASFCLAANEVEAPAKEGEKTVATATEEQKTTLITLYSWATILPKELIELQNRINKEKKAREIEQELPQLEQEIETIRWATTRAQTDPDIQLLQVANLQAKSQRVGSHLKKTSELLNELINSWSDARKEWLDKREQIQSIDKKDEVPLVLGEEQHKKLLSTVDEAIKLIGEHLRSVLVVGKTIGDMQIDLYTIDSDLQSLDGDLRVISIQQTAPSMLSKEFYSRIDFALILEGYQKTLRFFKERITSLLESPRLILLGVVGFTVVCFIILKTRKLTPVSSKWQAFAKRPYSATIFMGASINAFVNAFPLNTELPEQWMALLNVLTLFAVTRLTKHLVPNPGRRKLLNQLTIFMGITMVLFLMGFPQVLMLLYVFWVSIAAFFYYLLRLPSTRQKQFREVWLQKSWGLFPAIVVVFGLTGYDQLAISVFSTLLSSIIVCLVVWMLYLFHIGLLELLFSALPVAIISDNFTHIIRGLRPIIGWIHVIILITVQSVIWGLYSTTNTAFTEINNFGFDFGGIHVSLRFIFTVGLVFYGSLIISKAIQALLLKNVLPRYRAEKGVQLSITRLAHYAILTIGFIVMLRVLGFQLNQLTLLGGALGVGIGFGLQAIVNNFASGLILLFERPIKVGDTIQLGSEWGEVKQLGLRATIIQTFDNAEIVVPNSDLITSQVTNWTLADRRVRVRVPVGVAYGSDVDKVMEILFACGNANPMVLSNPKPVVYFLAFGASSLDFELRVWIPEFLDKVTVLSELNQDIDSEFAANNIEIPFPQSDLHLRTVDDEAAEQIRGRLKPAANGDEDGR